MLAGEDFGGVFDIDNGLSPSNVARWNHCWSQHQAEYAPFPESDSLPVSTAAWAALPEFSLPDLDGNRVRLADFRGKPVVLSFWAKDESNSVRQVPQWIEFQRRHPEIVVLAVSLDALTEHHDHSHGLSENHATTHEMHDHEAMHRHTDATAEEGDDGKSGEDVVVQIRRYATRNNINYRILIDRTGSTAEAFGGEDIPVCLWIDAEGQLRRRTRVTTGGFATLEALAKSSF